jgi:hypothetical protein
MPHPYVTQLRFARSEFMRGLEGVRGDEALQRVKSMNCISWIVGHLANQEHFLWVRAGQNRNIAPDLNDRVGSGKPPSTPPLDEMLSLWSHITGEADRYLDQIDHQDLTSHFTWNGKTFAENVGTLLLRNTYHYWFHLGEAMALRQCLGHESLPEYVGDMSDVRIVNEG